MSTYNSSPNIDKRMNINKSLQEKDMNLSFYSALCLLI